MKPTNALSGVAPEVRPDLPDRQARPRRLSSDVRREQLLDAAASIIVTGGLSSCSLEEVASIAGVSKPLVYKHFANRDELLRALVQREYDIIRTRGLDQTPDGASIEEAYRVNIRAYLEYLRDRGGLFRALSSDPGVSAMLHDAAQEERRSVTQFWVEETMNAYRLPKDLSRLGIIMTIAALDGAEGAVRPGRMNIERVMDFWMTFCLAGWAATSARFGQSSPIDTSRAGTCRSEAD